MTEFEESRLKFSFADTWQVFQLDSSRFYRERLSAQVEETKAVDFIGIYQQEVLYFIEVKNFKGHRIENKDRLEKSALSTEIAQKIRDSIACIIAANRTTAEAETWQEYKNLLCNPKNTLSVVIWLEQDLPKHKPYHHQNLVEMGEFKRKLSWLTSKVFVMNHKDCKLPDVMVENLPDPPNKS